MTKSSHSHQKTKTEGKPCIESFVDAINSINCIFTTPAGSAEVDINMRSSRPETRGERFRDNIQDARNHAAAVAEASHSHPHPNRTEAINDILDLHPRLAAVANNIHDTYFNTVSGIHGFFNGDNDS